MPGLEGVVDGIEFPDIEPGASLTSPDGRARWDGPCGDRGWMWMLIRATEDGWDFDLDFDGPRPSWVEYLRENLPYDLKVMLTKCGAAPGQPFRVEFVFACGEDWVRDWDGPSVYEPWSEFSYTCVEVEPWSEERVVAAWDEAAALHSDETLPNFSMDLPPQGSIIWPGDAMASTLPDLKVGPGMGFVSQSVDDEGRVHMVVSVHDPELIRRILDVDGPVVSMGVKTWSEP